MTFKELYSRNRFGTRERGRGRPRHTALRGGDAVDEVLLFLLAFGADGEGVEDAK